jgi:glycosyltransferase involved in cell wall biosynthesis
MVTDGLVPAESKVFFTDAWNPGIINVRYMSDLMGLDLELHGIWHAGVHDPHDFLGRNEKVQKWAFTFEKSVFQSLDKNYFASEFYKNMFAETFDLDPNDKRLVHTGHPNEFLFKQIKSLPLDQKENIILFPHRLAPEKQLEIFKDLELSLPKYQWIVCQEKKLSKAEYHDLLAKSKIVWSASLQETHGIAQTEAILANAISLNPDRLSYKEMYTDYFKYPSEWTLSWDDYLTHKDEVIALIKQKMNDIDNNPIMVMQELETEKEHLKKYLNADPIWSNLIS